MCWFGQEPPFLTAAGSLMSFYVILASPGF